MSAAMVKPSPGSVERVLLQGGFNRDAFLRAASLVKDRAARRGERVRDAEVHPFPAARPHPV